MIKDLTMEQIDRSERTWFLRGRLDHIIEGITEKVDEVMAENTCPLHGVLLVAANFRVPQCPECIRLDEAYQREMDSRANH